MFERRIKLFVCFRGRNLEADWKQRGVIIALCDITMGYVPESCWDLAGLQALDRENGRIYTMRGSCKLSAVI